MSGVKSGSVQASGAGRVDKPWGYELRWAITDRYLGKLIHIDGGHSLDDAQRILKCEGLTEQVEPGEGFGPFTVAHRRPDAVLHNGPLSRRLRIPPRHAGSNRRARMRELVNYAGSP